MNDPMAQTGPAWSELIRDAYLGLLGREPDASGLQHYVRRLNSNQMNYSGLLQSLVRSPEFKKKNSTSPAKTGPTSYLKSEAMAIFERFGFEGKGRAGYITNFIGGLTDIRFVKQLAGHSGVIESYPIPGNFHGDTLEWMGVLRSALDAEENFTMLELGAGWAPWSVIGFLAAKQRDINNIRLLAVEGDVGHVNFIEQSFLVNEIPKSVGRIIYGVVGIKDGVAQFPHSINPDVTYGGMAREQQEPGKELQTAKSAAFRELIDVPCYSLQSLVGPNNKVDLIHCDIQGSENDIFPGAMEFLTSCTKRVVVGTHSHIIDRNLVSCFGNAGWQLEYMLNSTVDEDRNGTPHIRADGTQVWKNPRMF